jgi:hypothetical protein
MVDMDEFNMKGGIAGGVLNALGDRYRKDNS